MSETVTTHHQARKLHRCDACLRVISTGAPYARTRWWDGGSAGVTRQHKECFHETLAQGVFDDDNFVAPGWLVEDDAAGSPEWRAWFARLAVGEQ